MKKTTHPFFSFRIGRIFDWSRQARITTAQSECMSKADLDTYVGIYTSADLKMKIRVTKNDSGNILMAGSDDASMQPLNEIDANIFQYSSGGMVMEFMPGNNKFALLRCGGHFPLIKEA